MVSGERRTDQTVWVSLAAFLAFAGSLFSGFHFDDYGMLQDQAIVAGDGWLRCFGWLQTRPLTWFSFWVNYQSHGREALLWHAVNVVLHMVCAVLLYRMLRRLMPEVATAAALIFAVHPVQSEPVDYVYARAIVLCALFSVLALREWIGGRVWVSAGWFTAALLAKEECVSLPLVLAMYSLWRGELRQRIAPIATMVGIALLAGLRVIAAIQATGMKNVGANAGISQVAYLSEQGLAILRYMGLLVIPWAFSIDPQIPTPDIVWRIGAWAAMLLLIAASAMRFGKSGQPAGFSPD